MSFIANFDAVSLVLGVTGSGKTSLINLANDDDVVDPSLTSMTSYPVMRIVGDVHNVLDTGGLLDNRIGVDRTQMFNAVINALRQSDRRLRRIYFCHAASERMYDEVLPWIADVLDVFAECKVVVVLTKHDTESAERRTLKSGIMGTMSKLFEGCDIICVGENNIKPFLDDLTAPVEFNMTMDLSQLEEIRPTSELMRCLEEINIKLNNLAEMLNVHNINPVHISTRLRDLKKDASALKAERKGFCTPTAHINTMIAEADTFISQIEAQGNHFLSLKSNRDNICKIIYKRRDYVEKARNIINGPNLEQSLIKI